MTSETSRPQAEPSGFDVVERLRHALAAIERMPPRVRVALEAYTVAELMEAIALRFGRPLSSLANDIARCRAMLDRATARNRGTVGHVLWARRPGAAARREALAELSRKRFDLLITDRKMPGMSGRWTNYYAE